MIHDLWSINLFKMIFPFRIFQGFINYNDLL